MQIEKITNFTPELIAELVDLWQESVTATHLFLTAGEIERIKEYVPQALQGVEHLLVAYADGRPAAFMGVDNGRLEMLFARPQLRGQGIGRELVRLAIDKYNVTELTVNEQNPAAQGFYKHLGFAVYKRTECDEQGGPYPLLYMRLNKK